MYRRIRGYLQVKASCNVDRARQIAAYLNGGIESYRRSAETRKIKTLDWWIDEFDFNRLLTADVGVDFDVGLKTFTQRKRNGSALQDAIRALKLTWVQSEILVGEIH